MTGDLAVWLRAQLDADETLATQSGTRSCWRVAFTLADITAKKTIVDDLALTARAVGEAASPEEVRESATAEWYLRLLAQPYAGRPGWHNEWTTT